MNNSFKVYVLKDPTTLEVRYVGYTGQKISNRLSAHIQDCKKIKNSYRVNWIRKLLGEGLQPIIEVIKDKLTHEDAIILEISLISKLPNLVNGTAGGDGIPNPSREIRRKISKTLKNGYKTGRILPTRHNKLGGQNHPMYGRLGVNNPNYGSKRNSEQIKSLSDCKKGEKNPMYGKESPMKGKTHSDESKLKMSKKLKGKSSKKRGTAQDVLQFDLNNILITEINGSLLGSKKANIYRCCKNITKTAYGYIWKFKNKL